MHADDDIIDIREPRNECVLDTGSGRNAPGFFLGANACWTPHKNSFVPDSYHYIEGGKSIRKVRCTAATVHRTRGDKLGQSLSILIV
jgi:hypothetical protein